MKNNNISRRSFLANSLMASAGFTLLPGFAQAFNKPSDQIRLGVIGLGRRAMPLVNNFMKMPGVRVLAGSDVYAIKRQRFEQQVNQHYSSEKKKPKIATYEDYRQLLDRKDIDAVVIATPDHWHAVMAIDACKAGKDIYLEKPLTFTIKEGQELVKAVRQNNRILAVGSQQRSGPGFQHAVDLVRSGKIGRLERVNAYTGARPPQPYDLPEEPIPNGLNWDLWLGPSPYVHFNNQLNPPISLDPPTNEKFWGAWRWYKELGGGLTTDWGAHMYDIAHWGMGRDNSGPIEVIPKGYQDYDYLTFRYDDGVVMTDRPWNEQNNQGVKFWGSDGWIEVTRDFFRSSNSEWALDKVKDDTNTAHELNFIEALRARKEPLVPVETGHRTCTVCTLGNIAIELQRPLKWDPTRETFHNDEAAQKHLHREYREGYTLG